MSIHNVGRGGTNLLNPFGPTWLRGKPGADSVTIGQQVQQTLFGKPKPRVLDASTRPHLQKRLAMLRRFRRKIAHLAGDTEDDYPMLLADGTIASVDGEGNIYLGADFLEQEGDEAGVVVGALAHEIGHRPKRWSQYQTTRELSKDELQAICREEEAKADAFAGTALAELELSPDALIAFLQRIQDKPHPDYFPAEVRGEIIREAYRSRTFRADLRRKMFPALDRATSAKLHLGDG